MKNVSSKLLAHGHDTDFLDDFKTTVKMLDCTGIYAEESEGAAALLEYNEFAALIVQVRRIFEGGESDLAFMKLVKSIRPGLGIIVAGQYKKPRNPKLIDFIREQAGVVYVYMGSTDQYLFNYLHQVFSIPLAGSDSNQKDCFSVLDKLDDYLDSSLISPHFQPIIDLKSEKIFAYESLARSKSNSLLGHPGILFEYAANKNMFSEIDYSLLEQSLLLSNDLPIGCNLFLNMQPRSLSSVTFVESLLGLMEASGRAPESICIELTEQDEIRNYKMFHASLSRLRDYGCLIAIDDFGAGNANLDIILHVEPDALKISGKIIRHLEDIPIVRTIVPKICEVCAEAGILSIAEYVETEAQAKILTDLGVNYGQGFHFGRPAPAIKFGS